MKVIILTQIPAFNYGCILQAYALQNLLVMNGFDTKILFMPKIDFKGKNCIWQILSSIKKLLLNFIFRKKNKLHYSYNEDVWLKDRIFCNLSEFRRSKLNITKVYLPVIDKEKIANLEADIFVVGSDQVWRPKYSPYQPHFFLDFVANRNNIKRIAYAASFGLDNNVEFNQDLLKICKPLAQKFDAISVREDSGIKLCKELFDVNAIQVLDPTLLLDAEHYAKLSFERNDFQNDGDLFTYVLDESKEKQNIIDVVINHTDLKPFRVLPKAKFREVGPKHIEDCVLPPVEQWLRAFVDAKYVVTDSFHGTVFSILFKRPFIAIGNSSRGMTRFTSLLKLFGLEDRLVLKPEEVTVELINKPIDYERVYAILEDERKKSKKFLMNALNIQK